MDAEQRRAVTESIGKVLAVTEKFSAEKLREYQLGQLEQLVRHATAQTGFYAGRLAPLFTRHGAFDASQWHKVPILTRQDMKQHGAQLMAQSFPQAHGPAYSITSSGTTGTPVKVVNTTLMFLAGEAAAKRATGWYGLEPDDRICSIGDAATAAKFESLGTDRHHITVSWTWQPSRSLEAMAAQGTRMVTGFPNAMETLCEEQLDRRAGIPLKFFVGTSMAVSERTRSLVSRAFGARAYDGYGSREAHKIAHECAHAPGLHVNSELVLVEIVDDDGKACEPGELGRVIVTPFLSTAQPLIRYEQGDLARWGEPCPCGRAHPVLAGIEGRLRHRFKFADGHSFMPGVGFQPYVDFLKADRWQVAQTGDCAIEVRYMTLAPDPALDFNAMTALFRANYHPDVAVTYCRVESMPLTATGKFLDYVNEYHEME